MMAPVVRINAARCHKIMLPVMWRCGSVACAVLCATFCVFASFPHQHLSDLSSTPNPSAMEPLLRARKTVGRFFEQSANVVCSESITQAIVGKNGSPSYREKSKYNYQLQSPLAPGAPKVG